MKRKLVNLWIICAMMCLLMGGVVLHASTSTKSVEAKELEQNQIMADTTAVDEGVAIDSSDIGANLYYALQWNLKGTEWETDILYSNSLYNAGITHLNLSIADIFSGAEYTYDAGLSGLKKFNLTKVESIDLSSSKLTEFHATDIVPDTTIWNNLTSIDLSNNALTEVTFGGKMTQLQSIDLHNNTITSVEMKSLIAPTITVNLNNNALAKVEDISMPFNSQSKVTISLYANAMVSKPQNTQTRIFQYGIQNLSALSLTSGDTVVWETMGDIVPHIFTVTYTDDGNIAQETLYKALDPDTASFTLPVNTYRMKYYNTATNQYLPEIEVEIGLPAYEFTIRPITPAYKILIDGKEYDKYTDTINGRPSLKIFGGEGQLYYSVGGANWIAVENGEIVNLDQYSGTYVVRIKNVENGIESKYVSVSLSTSLNAYLPDVVMLVLVIAIVLLIAFVALPLLKKYVIR